MEKQGEGKNDRGGLFSGTAVLRNNLSQNRSPLCCAVLFLLLALRTEWPFFVVVVRLQPRPKRALS
jgi:hypothetical protein